MHDLQLLCIWHVIRRTKSYSKTWEPVYWWLEEKIKNWSPFVNNMASNAINLSLWQLITQLAALLVTRLLNISSHLKLWSKSVSIISLGKMLYRTTSHLEFLIYFIYNTKTDIWWESKKLGRQKKKHQTRRLQLNIEAFGRACILTLNLWMLKKHYYQKLIVYECILPLFSL